MKPLSVSIYEVLVPRLTRQRLTEPRCDSCCLAGYQSGKTFVFKSGAPRVKRSCNCGALYVSVDVKVPTKTFQEGLRRSSGAADADEL